MILVINPGSTSTKIAVYDGLRAIYETTIRHTAEELAGFKGVSGQFTFRRDLIIEGLAGAGISINSLDAVIGRGGVVKPVPSGVYEINGALKNDLRNCTYGEHASNLGGLLAAEIAARAGIPAYIADPVVVDELDDVARITGLPQIRRVSIFHALNQKAVARKYAEGRGVSYESLNLIVAHLGGGISVGAHRRGRVVDVNNALDGDGPFSPERAGGLPAWQFYELCGETGYDGDKIRKMISGRGGVVAHLGTNDMMEVAARAANGDAGAKLVLNAMCYNVGKAIGAMAAVLGGNVDAVILTGGIAWDGYVCGYMEKMTGFIAEFTVMPGENEMEALAANALRVLERTETPKEYR